MEGSDEKRKGGANCKYENKMEEDVSKAFFLPKVRRPYVE
jgi:hypothetical protein